MAAELVPLTCGRLTVPTSLMLAGGEGSTTVPVTSMLIDHPHGRVLFDTGLHLATQDDPVGHLGELITSVNAVHHDTGEDVASRLEQIDVDPATIRYVVNSHLHYDHCGGNRQLPNATIIVQRAELDSAQELSQVHGYVTDDFLTGQPILAIDGEHDLFGDSSVVCFPTHGHTAGHQSMQVTTPSGNTYVLCGDACYFAKSLASMTMPAITTDPDRTRRSLEQLRELQRAGARMVFGHDPEQWASFDRGPSRLL